jgi:hypothetical protein
MPSLWSRTRLDCRPSPVELQAVTPRLPLRIGEILYARPDIEQVLREKKSCILRCMLDGIKKLQGRVVTWNRFASSVSITEA